MIFSELMLRLLKIIIKHQFFEVAFMRWMMKYLFLILAVLSNFSWAGCEGGKCTLAIDVLKNQEFKNPILTANVSFTVGNSVTLKTDTDFASIVSYGEKMEVGKDVELENIYQQGVLIIEKPTHVKGKIYAQPPATAKQTNFIKPNIEHRVLTSVVSLPKPTSTEPLIITNKELLLEAGRYGDVSVSKGKLTLHAGIYFFKSLDIGVDGKIDIDNKKGTAFIFVLQKLHFSGSINFNGAMSDLFVGYFGTNPVAIDGKFDAYLVAPNASIALFPAPEKQVHHLSIYAKSIDVKSGTKAVRAIPTYTGKAYEYIAHQKKRLQERDTVSGEYVDPQYLKDLSTLPNGELILAAIESIGLRGDDGRVEYEKNLDLLRENPEQTVSTFKKIWDTIPEKSDSIQDRKNLVVVLADLTVNEALPLLSEVGVHPINPEIAASYAGHQDSTRMNEYGIRGFALNGVKKLSKNGNRDAEEFLLNTTLHQDDNVIQRSAAIAYLLSGDIDKKREQLHKLLPDSEQHLANITFDVEPLNKMLEQQEQKRLKQQ